MSAQDVTSREGLSRGAEALKEKLADETGEHDKGMRALAARDIARAFVEELGITERNTADSVSRRMGGINAMKLRTLLELAGETHGE